MQDLHFLNMNIVQTCAHACMGAEHHAKQASVVSHTWSKKGAHAPGVAAPCTAASHYRLGPSSHARYLIVSPPPAPSTSSWMIVERAGDTTGTLAHLSPQLFAVLRAQMKLLPGGARPGSAHLAKAPVQKDGLGLQGIFSGLQPDSG